MNEQVKCGPVPTRLSFWRRLLSRLPGFCSYCGRRYRTCHSDRVSLFFPVPQTGMCCPDGHEGYVDEMLITGDVIRHPFDFVKHPQ